jgi:mercuric ion transport protein
MQIWRYLLAASAVLFLAGVVVQVFLAGMGLSGLGGGGMANHIDFGYTLSIVPIVPLVLTWPARAGGRTAILCAVLLVDAIVQTFLPFARDSVPWVAALHPVNALVIFGLGLVLVRRTVALARESTPSTPIA